MLRCTHFSLEIFEGGGGVGQVDYWAGYGELESSDICHLFWFICS